MELMNAMKAVMRMVIMMMQLVMMRVMKTR